MTNAAGVDLGTTYTCAATATATGGATVVQLSGSSQTIPSVVSITDTGVLAGEAAERRLVTHPATTVREFKRRLGDATPIVLAGEAHGAEVLTGHLLADVLQRIEQADGAAPEIVALSHPASWGPFRLDLLRDAARLAGVHTPVLVPEPVAAAIANRDRVDPDALVAVYDLGGGTFDAAIVRMGDVPEVIGTPEGVERLGGIDFDQGILAHVDAVLDGQIFSLDSSDPEARSALMQLRAECQRAKEHLSADSDVEIPVSLPDVRTSVRMNRSEFETIVRPRLADSLAVFDRVVASAGLGWDDISAVLLVGGSSNIPVVAQTVAEHTNRPIVTATNPHLAIALGAAEVAIRTQAGAPPAEVSPSAPTHDVEPSALEPPPAGSPRRSRMPILAGVVVLAIVGLLLAVVSFGGDSDTAAPQPAADQSESEITGDNESGSADAAQPTVIDCGNGLDEIDAIVFVDGRVRGAGSGRLAELETEVGDDQCSVNVDDRTAIRAANVPEPLIAASAAGPYMVLVGPSGGVVALIGEGGNPLCELIAGVVAINEDGDTFSAEPGGDVRHVAATGCVEEDNTRLRGVQTTAIGVRGTDQIAIGGSIGGSIGMRIVADETSVDLLDSDDTIEGGLGSVDAIAACGDAWCVVDLDRGALHVVTADGRWATSLPLAGTALESTTEVLSVSSGPEGRALLYVELGDGTKRIVLIG